MITTPNPQALDLVEPAGAGIVVAFEDPEAVADAAVRLRDDPVTGDEMAKRGYDTARARFHWPQDAEAFVATLEGWAS